MGVIFGECGREITLGNTAEDLFSAGRAGTARKGGRASTAGLKVRTAQLQLGRGNAWVIQ